MGKFSEMSEQEQDDYMDSLATGIAESMDRIATAVEGFHEKDGPEAPVTDEDLRFAIYDIESRAYSGAHVARRLENVEKVFQYIKNGTVPNAPSGSQ